MSFSVYVQTNVKTMKAKPLINHYVSLIKDSEIGG